MATHKLKTWPKYFKEVWSGEKDFEVRKKDRDFKVGDTLHLVEFDPETELRSGSFIKKEIKYILDGGAFGIETGYCVLGLKNFI